MFVFVVLVFGVIVVIVYVVVVVSVVNSVVIYVYMVCHFDLFGFSGLMWCLGWFVLMFTWFC